MLIFHLLIEASIKLCKLQLRKEKEKEKEIMDYKANVQNIEKVLGA